MTNDLLPLGAIEAQVRTIALRLTAPDAVLPTFGRSDHDGRPHVEVGEAYDVVVCERGSELERRSTLSLDELFYWIFEFATFGLAVRHEGRHRRSGEDVRRQLFAKQVELLATLDGRWGERRAGEHARILAAHPFVDS